MFNHSNFFAALLAMLKNKMNKKSGGDSGSGFGSGGTGDLSELMSFPLSKFDA